MLMKFRLKLLKLNNDLKQLEWLLFTGDPFHGFFLLALALFKI